MKNSHRLQINHLFYENLLQRLFWITSRKEICFINNIRKKEGIMIDFSMWDGMVQRVAAQNL